VSGTSAIKKIGSRTRLSPVPCATIPTIRLLHDHQ
jgi:hypothetical protein